MKVIKAKNFGNYGNVSPRTKDHKVIIIGESHSRNSAANIKSTTKDNFGVQGVVNPDTGANILANSVIKNVRSLSKNVILFCGGANDVGRNSSLKALCQITNFITDNKHTT